MRVLGRFRFLRLLFGSIAVQVEIQQQPPRRERLLRARRATTTTTDRTRQLFQVIILRVDALTSVVIT